MPPRVCPTPPDCPLYDQRMPYSGDEPLRRAILAERQTHPNLAALVRAEALRTVRSAPLLPAPKSALPLFVERQEKEVHHEQIARPSD
jgi:hypothetical protein